MIQKRFPADTGLDNLTFLNDKNVNGELYGLFQSLSQCVVDGNKYYTVVIKKRMPTQMNLCQQLGIKSPKTYRAHLQYLIDRGYILDEGDYYLLPNIENIFLLIPLNTLNYLKDNCRDHVIKIYIYLGQRYKYAQSQNKQYSFTLGELGEHVGLKVKSNSRSYEIINNALDLLYNSGLIKYVTHYENNMPIKKITEFNFEHKRCTA